MKKESTASPAAPVDIEAVIASAIGERRLLSHPFYQRWLDGTLEAGELAAYASQYRHFEAQLPAFLSTVLEQLPPGPAHDLVAANLTDELSVPAPHLALFDAFSAAVGAETEPPTPATQQLVSCYARWAGCPSAAAVGALAAYEVQAAEVAASKAAGLRERYGLDAAATEFWDVHATADLDHAQWVVGALAELAQETSAAAAMAAAAADTAAAWWAFLDEREAARPIAA
ncbi:MAG TPA: iron-containing redox enzyme family protein [Acidimicrobiales bacterium]|nr:iron-containing redox enzyme family protein [Acidimicrobiales bacterium]